MIRKPLLLFLFMLFLSFGQAADYFWIGGTGNWSDISHWVTSSGGTTQHAQTPTANDNVFFDVNSFTAPGQTITIDIDVAFCRNLDFLGARNVMIEGETSRTLQIFGSLRLIPTLQFNFLGDLHFRSNDPGNQLVWAGHRARRDVYFDNQKGSWILQDQMLVDSNLIFNAGVLNLANSSVSVNRFLSETNAQRGLVLDGSTLTILSPTRRNKLNYSILDYPLSIFTDGLSTSALGSSILLLAANADIYFIGSAPIDLGSVIFDNPDGRSRILRERADQNLKLTFDVLTFKSNGVIYGDNQIQSLNLSGAKSYQLESGRSQQIGMIQANGSCNTSILLSATNAGSQASIRSSTSQLFDYLTVRDIEIVGGATFAVNNAIDLGNNTGWSFDSRFARVLYWVGGTGNWDDSIHWSSSDSGPGGECPPTAIDDVYLTAGSFGAAGMIRINVEDALCHDLICADLPPGTNLAGFGEMHIFGSAQLHPNLTISKSGSFHFEGSDSDLTITSNGVVFPQHVFFNGIGGWTLQDALFVEDSMMFFRGTINTNDQPLQIDYFLSDVTNQRTLILGSTRIFIPDNEHYGENRWDVRVDNFNLDAGTSLIEIEDPNAGFIHRGQGSLQYHDLTFSNYGGYGNMYSEYYCRTSFNRVQINQYAGMSGRHTFEQLVLTPAKTYAIYSQDTIVVGELISNGTCEQPVTIRSDFSGVSYIRRKAGTQNVNFTVLKNIHAIGGASFNAIQSVDLGHNQGWNFDEPAIGARYWVGGTGDWHDTGHWATSSGGLPGACVPTPLDDVYFDQNSFSAPGQYVDLISADGFCRSMSWEGSQFNPRFFQGADLWIYGSLKLIPDMDAEIYQLYFVSDSLNQTIDMAGQQSFYMTYSGEGGWNLKDSIANQYWINMLEGSFATNGHRVRVGDLFMGSYEPTQKINVDLDSSVIEIRIYYQDRGLYVFSDNLNLDPGQSFIEATLPSSIVYLNGRKKVDFYDLKFSATTGLSRLENFVREEKSTFNKAHFISDGQILGEITYDTLIFSAGKTYTLESRVSQVVLEYLSVRGNNCAPINLRATQGGQRAVTKLTNTDVSADFVQMQDQEAQSNRNVFAGTHSTDIGGSNKGWIFENAPDLVEFGLLGEDQVLCQGTSVILDANSFTSGEQYLWNDGSSAQTREVSMGGKYAVAVTFQNNCVLRDSVNVVALDDFTPQLGKDTALCEGKNLILTAEVDAIGVQYLWQDGSVAPTLNVIQPGQYFVNVTLDGCSLADTIEVNYVTSAAINLGQDVTVCAGDSFLLIPEVNMDGVAYTWQDNSKSSSFLATQEGIYWVDVAFNNCVARDSIQINHLIPPVDILGPDREICFGEITDLDATNDNATYQWSDGSTKPILSTSQAGIYTVAIMIDQCLVEDAVKVSDKPSAIFDLGSDTTLCPNEFLELDLSQPNVQFSWSDGDIQPQKRIESPGRFTVAGILDGCITRDTIDIEYHSPPSFELGPDTTVCDALGIDLDVPINNVAFLWNTGETSPKIHVESPGLYTLEVADDFCSSTDSVLISFRECVFFSLFVPNAITPNGDNVNDALEIFIPQNVQVNSYRLLIHNRWGNLLYSSSDRNEQWDGKINGQILEGGVYLYSLEVSYQDDNGLGKLSDAGTITLVR